MRRQFSLCVSFVPVIWSLFVWSQHDSSGPIFQLLCDVSMLQYGSFGVNVLGLSLIILTSALFPLCLALVSTKRGTLLFLTIPHFISRNEMKWGPYGAIYTWCYNSVKSFRFLHNVQSFSYFIVSYDST
jgi:NADH:ubiquinone oxidoreductase subunit 4 (subunit M)